MLQTTDSSPVVEVNSSEPLASLGWNWPRLIWYTVIVAIVYLGSQILGIVAVGVSHLIANPEFDIDKWSVTADGMVSTVCLLTSLIAVPVIYFVARRREKRPWHFLGFRQCSVREILYGIAAVSIFIAISDTVTFWFGRSIVPKFMLDEYTAAQSKWLLSLGIVLAAPILEEFFFRGFLFSAFKASGASLGLTVLILSLGFTALHTQYEFFELTLVFFLSLLLFGARIRSKSVVPSIAMHIFVNAIAVLETLFVLSR